MEIWKMFLLFGSVVITVTSGATMNEIPSDRRISDACKAAYFDLKSLAEKYVKILETDIENSISLASSKKENAGLLTPLTSAQSSLNAFEDAIKARLTECKSFPPSVEHASAVVNKDIATQHVTVYTCNSGYTYGGGKTNLLCDHEFGIWDEADFRCIECSTKQSTYQGKTSVTQGGIECQRWDSQSPHNHGFQSENFPDSSVTSAENYCRIPEIHGGELWCYTTDPSLVWDYCGIPTCNRKLENDCGSPQLLANANTRYNYTSNGARASYECVSLSGSTKNQYCPVSKCTNTGWTVASVSCGEHDCFRNSQEYIGKRSCTVSGRTCQEWKKTHPHDHRYAVHTFPDGSASAASNYCRDPDGSGSLWCYTMDSNVRYEMCDVPSCDKFP